MVTVDNLFFELIQIALGNKDRLSHNPSKEEWENLFLDAQKQSVVGIAFEGVQKLPKEQWPSQALLFEWIGVTEMIKQRNELLNKQCVKLQEQFKDTGISLSILKGQGIARYYGDKLISLRQSGDIDVYVDCGRERVLQFASSLGLKDVKWDYKHLHLNVFPDTEVEVHYRVEVLLNLWKNRKLQKWFRNHEYMLFSQNGDLITPSVEFNRFYILLHIYRHFLYEGVGLRQLLDYYFVLNANTKAISKTDISELLKEFGMWKFARGVMWVMQRVFGLEKDCLICEPLEEEGRFILSEVMEGGNFGHYDERLSSARGGKLQTMKKVVKHNVHLMRHYPSEIIWPPIWFVWHKCWKMWIQFKGFNVQGV